MTSLYKRFLKFIENVKYHRKGIVSNMYETISRNVVSTTGYNLRRLMLKTNCNSIEELSQKHLDALSYHPINESNYWRIDALSELIDVRNNTLNINGFDTNEINTFINLISTN